MPKQKITPSATMHPAKHILEMIPSTTRKVTNLAKRKMP
jgi:hypothetical protein